MGVRTKPLLLLLLSILTVAWSLTYRGGLETQERNHFKNNLTPVRNQRFSHHAYIEARYNVPGSTKTRKKR